MKNYKKYRKALPVAISAASLSFSMGSLAEFQLEEVLVTATKRSAANIQDIPFAVQALGGKKLESIGATDFDDFFHLVPGLAVFDQGPGDKRYIIRGVNSTGAGTVGLYLDEAIITGENAQDGGGRQPDIKLFDIDRVEVLKGPQGTTFGSSSLSGTIRYITNKPNLEETELEIGGGLRAIDGADLGYELNAAVSVPVISDKLAVRLAGYYLDEKGYIDNILDDGVNNDETTAARLSVLFQATDDLKLTFMAMNQDTETDGLTYYNETDYNGAPLSEFEQADVARSGIEDDITIYNGTLEYVMDAGTIIATASRLDRDSTLNRDASLALDRFIGRPFLTTGRSVITQPKERTVDSYEIRFSSDWDGPVQLLTGVFAQNEERSFRSAVLAADSNGNIIPGDTSSLDRNVSTELDETAVFAELSYDITDQWTITGGLRWFEIEIDEVAESVRGITGSPGSGVGPKLSSSESDVIGKVNIGYQINDDVLAYFQWAEGFRSGGANDQTAAAIANVVIPEGFGSDSLQNYELGIKSTLADGRLVANAAIYFIDWSDIQLRNQATDGNLTFPYRGNGGAAEITGLEFDVAYYPTDSLELSASGNFVSAELVEDNPIPSSGLAGDNIPYTPEMSLSASALYNWGLSSGLDAFVGGDVIYVDDRDTELRPNSPNQIDLDSYTLVNLRGGVKTEDWSVTLAVNNLFNDDTVTDVLRVAVNPDGFLTNRPRTVTLSATKSF